MDYDRERVGETVYTDPVEEGRKGGAAFAATAPGSVPVMDRYATASEVGEAAYLGVSRAAWPAIVAGFFIGTMTYLLFNTLGAALGLTWLNNDAVSRGEMQTAATIWLIVSTLVSFFVGGLATGRLMGLPGNATGAMNGFVYGCFSIIVLAVLAAFPVFGNLPTLAALFTNITPQDPNMAANVAQATAWWAFIGLVATLAAATVGGMAGARHVGVDPLTTGQAEVHRTRATA
jgi:hypothetical protein